MIAEIEKEYRQAVFDLLMNTRSKEYCCSDLAWWSSGLAETLAGGLLRAEELSGKIDGYNWLPFTAPEMFKPTKCGYCYGCFEDWERIMAMDAWSWESKIWNAGNVTE